MRRLFVGMVVAAATTVVPLWAMAGNQEVAEEIAANLRNSGQLHGFKVGVKYQDGTAWLSGRVGSREEEASALELASDTPGVERVVNQLTIASDSGDSLPLQQISGALSPDSVGRPISTDLTVPTANTQAPKHLTRAAGSTVPQADKVATSFTRSPARRVAATSSSRGAKSSPARTAAVPVRPVMMPVHQGMPAGYGQPGVPMPVGQPVAQPMPQYITPMGGGVAPVRYDQPHLPSYAWPSYAAYPNYAALTYPKHYSPTAWPYIGPFYPYPQVPLGWRKVTLQWCDGWWHLDFDDGATDGPLSALWRGPCHD